MSEEKEQLTKAIPRYLDVKESYSLAREKILHEDELVNQRLTWFITLNALLFTALSFSLTAQSTIISKIDSASSKDDNVVEQIEVIMETSQLIQDLRFALVLAGTGTSIAAFMGILAAYRRISNERVNFYSYLHFAIEKIEEIGGLDDKSGRLAESWIPRLTGKIFTNSLGMTCGLLVPIIIGSAWQFIGFEMQGFFEISIIVLIVSLFAFVGGCAVYDNANSDIRIHDELYHNETLKGQSSFKKHLLPSSTLARLNNEAREKIRKETIISQNQDIS